MLSYCWFVGLRYLKIKLYTGLLNTFLCDHVYNFSALSPKCFVLLQFEHDLLAFIALKEMPVLFKITINIEVRHDDLLTYCLVLARKSILLV